MEIDFKGFEEGFISEKKVEEKLPQSDLEILQNKRKNQLEKIEQMNQVFGINQNSVDFFSKQVKELKAMNEETLKEENDLQNEFDDLEKEIRKLKELRSLEVDDRNKVIKEKEERFSKEKEGLMENEKKKAINEKISLNLEENLMKLNQRLNIINADYESIFRNKKEKEEEIKEFERKCVEYDKRLIRLCNINYKSIDENRFYHNELQEAKGNIRVYCRLRPKLAKEQDEVSNDHCFIKDLIEIPNENTIVVNGPLLKSNVGKSNQTYSKDTFKFDRVFNVRAKQETVFEEVSQLVQSALDGYKVCIFAYGQTGGGKTYTMEGVSDYENRGMIPRSIEKIFDVKSQMEENGWSFEIEISSLEIYMDQLRDLLSDSNKPIKISNIANTSSSTKYSSHKVNKLEQVMDFFEYAKKKKVIAETEMNEFSSRSHCIFQIKIFGKNANQIREGALNLIDLAGSERISRSKVEEERLKETISINKSLTALKSVINALIQQSVNKNIHVPYRDSVLTYLLQPYLGGESKTLMFVNISDLFSNYSETLCSLKFATDVNQCPIK
jgi:kinesin family protein C1